MVGRPVKTGETPPDEGDDTSGTFWGLVDFDPGPGVYNSAGANARADSAGLFVSQLLDA